eukprot:365224-Chlamydomonas_euryale.AAC.8
MQSMVCPHEAVQPIGSPRQAIQSAACPPESMVCQCQAVQPTACPPKSMVCQRQAVARLCRAGAGRPGQRALQGHVHAGPRGHGHGQHGALRRV